MGAFKLGKMTIGSLFKKPETVLYPIQKKTPPAGLKGHIELDVSKCILCSICAKRCPCSAIEVDKKGRVWSCDHYRCVQCGSCVLECPKVALAMHPEYAAVARQKSVDAVSVPEQPKPERKREKAVEAAGAI